MHCCEKLIQIAGATQSKQEDIKFEIGKEKYVRREFEDENSEQNKSKSLREETAMACIKCLLSLKVDVNVQGDQKKNEYGRFP